MSIELRLKKAFKTSFIRGLETLMLNDHMIVQDMKSDVDGTTWVLSNHGDTRLLVLNDDFKQIRRKGIEQINYGDSVHPNPMSMAIGPGSVYISGTSDLREYDKQTGYLESVVNTEASQLEILGDDLFILTEDRELIKLSLKNKLKTKVMEDIDSIVSSGSRIYALRYDACKREPYQISVIANGKDSEIVFIEAEKLMGNMFGIDANRRIWMYNHSSEDGTNQALRVYSSQGRQITAERLPTPLNSLDAMRFNQKGELLLLGRMRRPDTRTDLYIPTQTVIRYEVDK